MSRNDDYTTGNLLDYLYHEKYYKLIDVALLRQTNTSALQQINFVGKLEEVVATTMLFINEKQQKKNSKFFFRFIDCCRITWIMEHQKY